MAAKDTTTSQSTDDMTAAKVKDPPESGGTQTQDEEDGLAGPGSFTYYRSDGDLYREQHGYSPEVLVPDDGWKWDDLNVTLATVLTPDEATEMAGSVDLEAPNSGDLGGDAADDSPDEDD